MKINAFTVNLIRITWFLLDAILIKRSNYWAFSTHHISDNFVENQRAVFEHIKHSPEIKKIIFYRGEPAKIKIDRAVNYEIVRHGSLRGIFLLAQCKAIFISRSISMDFSLRWGQRSFRVLKIPSRHRVIVNLWHGIPIKRLLYTANDKILAYTDRVRYWQQERKNYAGLIASSDIDSYAMAAMFYPLNYRQMWVTGLPRNDFLIMPEEDLPEYIQDSISTIRSLKSAKQLILYAPTYRQTAVSEDASYYQFSKEEISLLKAMLDRENAVLGYRPHYFKNNSEYFNLDQYIDNELIFDMSQTVIPEFSALARECDLLITDYSSVYIEALYLSKPIICFGYDIEHYIAHEDGLLYDMDLVFPGPILRRFDELIAAIESQLHLDKASIAQKQKTARRIFFKHNDAMNSHRVKEEVFKRL